MQSHRLSKDSCGFQTCLVHLDWVWLLFPRSSDRAKLTIELNGESQWGSSQEKHRLENCWAEEREKRGTNRFWWRNSCHVDHN